MNSRDKFEHWFKKVFPGQSELLTKREKGGWYIYASTDNLWAAWQEASQPIVVELPQGLSPEGYHIDEAYMIPDPEGEYLDRDEVIDMLDKAGVKHNG